MTKQKAGFLYVISETPAGPCKVGYASNLYHRLQSIQVGNPRSLTPASAWQCKSGPIKHYERQLHTFLCERAIRGEWFDVQPSVIEDLCRQIGLINATAGFDFSRKPTEHDDRLSWLM